MNLFQVVSFFYNYGSQPDVGYIEVAQTCSCDIQINVVYLTDSDYLPSLQFEQNLKIRTII